MDTDFEVKKIYFKEGENNIECVEQQHESNIQKNKCVDKLVLALNSLLKENEFTFIDEKDIVTVILHFLEIFCINDLDDKPFDKITEIIDIIQECTDRLVSDYKEEVLLDMRNVCNIFGILGNLETKTSTFSIIWSDSYSIPIYLSSDENVYPDINDNNLTSILNQIKQLMFVIKSTPEITYYDYIKERCSGMNTPNGRIDLSNLKNVSSATISFAKDVHDLELQYSSYIYTGFGQEGGKQRRLEVQKDDVSYSDEDLGVTKLICKDDQLSTNNNQEDDCEDEFDSKNRQTGSSKYKYLTVLGKTVQTVSQAYWKIYNILSSAVYMTGEYKKMHIKVCRILDIFNKSVINSIKTEVPTHDNNILKKTIIMSLDLSFFQFSKHLLIDQLKSDRLDQFSIERILINIASYFIEHSNLNKQYINIHEQNEDNGLRITIIFFLSIFGHLLSCLKEFEIPIAYINSISIPMIVGMTMRKNIKCPNESVRTALIENIISNTSNYGKSLFTRSSTYHNENNIQSRRDVITNSYGNVFQISIDDTIKNKLVCTC